jgi:hypothetical protein
MTWELISGNTIKEEGGSETGMKIRVLKLVFLGTPGG